MHRKKVPATKQLLDQMLGQYMDGPVCVRNLRDIRVMRAIMVISAMHVISVIRVIRVIGDIWVITWLVQTQGRRVERRVGLEWD